MKNKNFPTRSSLVFHFMRGAKRWFFLAIVFALLMQVLSLINPKIIGFTVDSIIGNEPADVPSFVLPLIEWAGGIPYLKEHLYLIALAVVFIALCSATITFLFRLCNSIGAETLVKRIRDCLFEHIGHLPFSWYSENRTGDIIQRCTSDVETIKVFLSEQLTALIRIVIMILMALYFMMGIHVKLALISAAFIPIIVLYSFFFHSRIGATFRKTDEEEGRLSAIVQENLTGVRVVRAFGRESYERERFEKQNSFYTKMWVDLMRLLSLFWSTGDLFSGLQILTVTALGAVFCVQGQMTAGDYIAFVSYNAMLTWPVRSIGRVIAQLSKAGVSIDRLAYIMNSEVESDVADATDWDMHQDIVFNHVSFSYEAGGQKILDDVSFTIPKGTTFGILGGTGSGKSTLVSLLDRLYDLKDGEGEILVGGRDIRKIRRGCLRENIGMVLQEPYLFSRTLSENIRIARQSSSMAEVRDAARIACLDDSIERFQHGYDTYVGERGVTLSGGQKQRAAIAQMLIRRPPVMVFDDSLSAVDAETDAKIRKQLQQSTGDSTVILIAHRITTLMQADCIVVLDQGRVKEMGTHEELLAMNGIYKKMFDMQMRGDEEVK